ncbi:MAG: hypothetical protein ACREHF_15375 [Rhizomicrobium sp.]
MSLVAYIAITGLVAFFCGGAVATFNIMRRGASDTSEWTPEHIAYVLMRQIAAAEGKRLPNDKGANPTSGASADRKWLLDTFAECMQAVREPDKRVGQPKL